MEVFVYQFFFEFNQQVVQFFNALSRYNAESHFLVSTFSAALALLIRPGRKFAILLLAAFVAFLPLILKLSLHGAPSMYVPDYGRYMPVSYILTALSGLSLCLLSNLYAISGDYEAGKVGHLGGLAIIVSVVSVLSVCPVLSIYLTPPLTFEENRSSYVAWLATHLVFRFLLVLSVLSLFNYVGLKRVISGKLMLQAAGLLLGAGSAVIVYQHFQYIHWGLTLFFQSTSSSSAI